MKKNRIVLGLILASVSLSLGCGKSGVSHLPSITSVSPSEGSPNTTVTLTLSQFNVARDIVLFGGVPVKVVDASTAAPADLSNGSSSRILGPSDVFLKRQTVLTTGLSNIKVSLTGTTTVPTLDAGDIIITVRRGDHESEPVSFKILGSDSAGKSVAATPPSDGSTTGAGEAVPPPAPAGDTSPPEGSGVAHAGEIPPGADDGTTGATGPTGGTTPPETHHEAVITFAQGYFSSGFSYQKISWSVSYVDAAFIRVPVDHRYIDPISFGQFQGQTNNPMPYSALDGEASLLAKFADNILSTSFGDKPVNYCLVPGKGQTLASSELCYSANPNNASASYIDVALPLSKDSNSKAGVWKFRLPGSINVFTLYYRDWTKTLKKKDLKVVAPGYGC